MGVTARRIVSLLPSATEIVAALGLTDRLVGITHECDHPAEIAHLPRLTSDLAATATTSREIDAAVRNTLSDGHGLYRLDAPELAVQKASRGNGRDRIRVLQVAPQAGIGLDLSTDRLDR